jgi:hypothetical protein
MTEIIVKGRNARMKVLAALAQAFPGKVPGWTVDNSHLSKEIKMTNQDALLGALSELEAEVDKQIATKAKKPETVEDWSDTDGGPLNLSGEDDDEDNGDDTDLDDDADDEDDQIGKAAPPHHHKFETVTQRIAAERKLPMTAAAKAARVENPSLFRDYQSSGLENNAASSGQQLTTYDKRDRAFTKLVQQEMATGIADPVCAAQRVIAKHGPRAADLLKGAAAPSDFMSAVDVIKKRDGCSRVVALQKARQENPRAFRLFRNV